MISGQTYSLTPKSLWGGCWDMGLPIWMLMTWLNQEGNPLWYRMADSPADTVKLNIYLYQVTALGGLLYAQPAQPMPPVSGCEAEMDTIQDVTTSGGWGGIWIIHSWNQLKGFSDSRCSNIAPRGLRGASSSCYACHNYMAKRGPRSESGEPVSNPMVSNKDPETTF